MRYLQPHIFRFLPVLFIIASMTLFPAVAFAAYKTSLSDTHIQSRLVIHFPIREYAAFAKVTLYEPQVILSRDSRDLLLVIPVDANIPDQPQKQGHVRVALKISYRPGDGGLYLNNPRVIEFEMPNVSKTMSMDLKTKIATICMNAMPLMQIFKLEEKNLNHSLAKSSLKSYFVKDGFLDLEFGFD